MLLRVRRKAHYAKHKEAARALVHARLAYYNTFYGHTLRKVFIKNTKSRWGSCSERGNLNFNYKILFIPSELQDYIIVHELCHLRAFNHGPDFWALVARTVPNWRAHRRALRKI
ncbi:MAG: M48 family metallopeptidase [Patescibacteria group bacterium]